MAIKIVSHLTDSISRLAGGMFESVPGLARGIDAVGGWRTITFSMHDAHTNEDLATWEGLDTVISPPSWFGALGSALSVQQRVIKVQPAVLHVHGIWGISSRAAWTTYLIERAPSRIVVSPRGMLAPWALSRSRTKKALAWSLWTGGLLRSAGCLHALGEPEARSIAQIVPGPPICIIPNGVDIPVSDVGSGSREKSVLFLGRIHPKKGLEELLAGWAKANISAAGWRLDIAGWDDGGHLEGLKVQAAKHGLGHSVRFLGAAFGPQKAALLRHSGAFVLPSFSEGLPMAVLEAWSYGLPVLMTEACNLAEGFDVGAALRCLPEPESISAALRKIATEFNDQERVEMGARGRALVAEQFSWSGIGKQHVEVYEWLIGGAQRSDAPGTVRFA